MNAKHLTVVAILKAKPNQIEVLRQELFALIPTTRQEAGCLGYDLHQDIDQPTRFIFYENWRSKADLDTHLNRPHLKAFVAQAPDLLDYARMKLRPTKEQPYTEYTDSGLVRLERICHNTAMHYPGNLAQPRLIWPMTRRQFLGVTVFTWYSCNPGFSQGHTTRIDSTVAEQELIRDPHFQNGFMVIDPKPGKRVPYGVIPGLAPDQKPVWDLDQWSSKFALEVNQAPKQLPGGSPRYGNTAKAIIVGKPGSPEADLSLTVMGSAEYGTCARKSGEPWVHLLVQQEIQSQPALAELAVARLQVEARLKRSRKISTPDYSPHLHAAQFQIFFSVQNRNRQSAGYGQYLWFGIPLYDDRQRFPAAHKAQDTGGTAMFIFTPPGEVYTTKSAHDKEWITIDQDLLPLMRDGLATAWQRGFLKDSQSLADYRISEMNLGWEVPGIFDVEMQVRNLSLKVTPR